MEEYLYNPDLKFVKKDYKGNLFRDGQFTNYPWPDTVASFKLVFKWFITPNPQREEKKKDTFSLKVIKNQDVFESKEDCIVWLGHSSFYIRLGGVNLLLDPVLSSLPLLKRFSEFPTSFEKIKNLDYVLLSHGHRDHLDESSLKKIFLQNPKAKVLCPLKIGKLVEKVNSTIEIQEAGWYQQYNTNPKIKITMLPALHWNRRNANDFNKELWGSFMLEAENQKIFFAGDTAYGSHFSEIKNVMGAPDICLLPIGAYKPQFLMKASHTDPFEAIQAFKDLEGKKFIPMHYGTFDLANEPIGEPIGIIRKELDQKYLLELAVGEKYLL